jgi:hypothetical protein
MTRRLQVLPEVLPAPTVTPRSSSPGVRSQTLAHMQRLLATAAAIPLAGCTRADTQTSSKTVTIPVASATAPEGADASVHGSLLPPPKATATAVATATAPTTGYAVVDPMPAPARCMGLASASKTAAVFKRHGKDWVLEVTLTLPSGASWGGMTFAPSSTPSVWSGQIVASSVTHRTAKVTMRPTAGASMAGVLFPVACAAGRGGVSVTATYSGAPASTTKISLSTRDY